MLISYNNPRVRNLYYRLPPPAKELVALVYSCRERRNRFGGDFATFGAEIERNARKEAGTHGASQLSRLRELLVYVGAHVPYYRAAFRSAAFDPAEIRSLTDLRRLPFLDKETVRANPTQLLAERFDQPTIATHTSGTTGKGLHLQISRAGYQRSYACMWFHYGWMGVKRGDRIATMAGHPVAAPGTSRPPFWVFDRLENELLFSSQHLSASALPAYANALAEFNPAIIRGYPSSIYPIALHLLETNRDDVRPRAVFTSSETLSDYQRQAIESAFDCPVYSYYSNAERAAHILQCKKGNFHVVPEAGIVEVVDPDGSPTRAGDSGELVCTSLIDRAMPLIRYRVGDIAVPAAGSCPCGYDSPILSDIVGRVEDVVVTPDGNHVGRLDHAFKDMLNVREAQLVQEDASSLLVTIAPRPGYGPADQRLLLDELRLRLGPLIRIELRLVDHIPRTQDGKFQFVVSRVTPQLNLPHDDRQVAGTGQRRDVN